MEGKGERVHSGQRCSPESEYRVEKEEVRDTRVPLLVLGREVFLLRTAGAPETRLSEHNGLFSIALKARARVGTKRQSSSY